VVNAKALCMQKWTGLSTEISAFADYMYRQKHEKSQPQKGAYDIGVYYNITGPLCLLPIPW